MAVYAAYRHIELDNVGYGKKRVLKPPGGGSSDIFGAPASEEAPRRRVDRNASAVPVGEDFWETPSKAVKPDGNPTAAEGRNGTDGAKEVRNGDSANANVADVGGNNAPSATQRRGRVPPGGFSSGLW